jgi:hypothetical protein
MGLDLEVCPVSYDYLDWWLLHNRMRFKRDYDLFDEIKKLQTIPIPENKVVQVYEDEGIEEKRTDPWEKELKYVRAEEFSKLEYEIDEGDKFSKWNFAIISMVKNLQKDTPIVLYWC